MAIKGPFSTPNLGRAGEETASLLPTAPNYAAAESIRGSTGALFSNLGQEIGKGLVNIQSGIQTDTANQLFSGLQADIQNTDVQQASQDQHYQNFGKTVESTLQAIDQGKLKSNQAYSHIQNKYNQLVAIKPALAKQAAMLMKQRLGYDPTRGALTGSASSAQSEQEKFQKQIINAGVNLATNPNTAHFAVYEDGAVGDLNKLNPQATIAAVKRYSDLNEQQKTIDANNTQSAISNLSSRAEMETKVLNNSLEMLSNIQAGKAGVVVVDNQGRSQTVFGEQALEVQKQRMVNLLRQKQNEATAESIKYQGNKDVKASYDTYIGQIQDTIKMVEGSDTTELLASKKIADRLSSQTSILKSQAVTQFAKIAPSAFLLRQGFGENINPAVFQEMVGNLASKEASGTLTSEGQALYGLLQSSPYGTVVAGGNMATRIKNNVPISQEPEDSRKARYQGQFDVITNMNFNTPNDPKALDTAKSALKQVTDYFISSGNNQYNMMLDTLHKPSILLSVNKMDAKDQQSIKNNMFKIAAQALQNSEVGGIKDAKGANKKIVINWHTGDAVVVPRDNSVGISAFNAISDAVSKVSLLPSFDLGNVLEHKFSKDETVRVNKALNVLDSVKDSQEGLGRLNKAQLLLKVLKGINYPSSLVEVIGGPK